MQKFNLKISFGIQEVVEFPCRIAFYTNRVERSAQLLQQPEVIATTVEEVSTSAKPLVRQLQRLPKRIKKIIASLPDQEVYSSSCFSPLLTLFFHSICGFIGVHGIYPGE